MKVKALIIAVVMTMNGLQIAGIEEVSKHETVKDEAGVVYSVPMGIAEDGLGTIMCDRERPEYDYNTPNLVLLSDVTIYRLNGDELEVLNADGGYKIGYTKASLDRFIWSFEDLEVMKDYCRCNNIVITPECWEYIEENFPHFTVLY